MPFYPIYIAYVYNKVIPCPDLQFFQKFYTDLKNRSNNNNNNKNKNYKNVGISSDDMDDDMDDDINDNNLDHGQQIFDAATSDLLQPSKNDNNAREPAPIVNISNDNKIDDDIDVQQNYGNQKKQFCYMNDDIYMFYFNLLYFLLFSFLFF